MFIELCKHEGPQRGIVRTRYLKSCLLIMLNNIKLDTEYGLFLEFVAAGFLSKQLQIPLALKDTHVITANVIMALE